jgi:DNA-binding LacI/PurR family transcriptional regulator
MSEKRAVTMDDIARLVRVSKPTVSRALNNSPLVKERTKNRVLAVAHEQGYAVNRNAQKLRRKRTNTIAVSLDFGSHQQGHIADPCSDVYKSYLVDEYTRYARGIPDVVNLSVGWHV